MKKALQLLLTFCIALIALPHVALAGFGITPPYVRSETLRPGSEFSQEIIIVRSDPVEDLSAELTLNVPGIESWFSFDKGLKFTLPKGESQVKMNVIVRVPEDAKLGLWNGNIRLRTESLAGPTTGVSLALGAQIDVHLKVVEEIYDFQVQRVELFEAEEGHKKWWLDFPGKIKFAMFIENTGNIPATPMRVSFDIYDSAGQRLLESSENTNTIDSILPFATKKIYAYLPTHLPPGGYRVKYDIVKTADQSAQKGELALSILPRGTITGYDSYGFDGLSYGDIASLVLPVLIVVGTMVVWGTLRSRRPRRRKTRRVVYEEQDDDDDDEPRNRVASPSTRGRDTGGVVDLSRRR